MEDEMETNGIVSLSNVEIEQVSGSKSILGRYWDSLASWFDGLSGPPGTASIPMSSGEIADLTRYVEESGGSATSSGSLIEGTLNIRLTSGDGTFTFVNVTGIR
jgi:hypothetical protein